MHQHVDSAHQIFIPAHCLAQQSYALHDCSERSTDCLYVDCYEHKQVRIKCRDYVRKIAVYRDRLAVQLPDKVHVYEVCTKQPCTLRTLSKHSELVNAH
jgi:hypothetical protein